EVILQNHEIYVYPRVHSDLSVETSTSLQGSIHKISAPVIEISSTFIRECIKQNKNVSPMLPIEVWSYIEHNLFYKK
ncbi:hypothetical protein RZS08_10855, partial [Arthrospira platensis SPKY1]|nr:hypothetical protein [Arthrospira platensis SPKY1]